MNSIAKITIPIEKLYQSINSTETLNAQRLTANIQPIESPNQYTAASNAIAQVNAAVKAIQDARKMVTGPLDAYKKELMRIESDATEPLQAFIASTKAEMLKYTAELNRKQQEEQKRIQEQSRSIADLTDQLADVSIQHSHIKGIRTIRRARITGEVDWMKVLSVLFGSGMYKPEDLTQNLLKAMEKCGVTAIAGIEIYEEQIQTITS
jgi:hypothetical protein